MTSKSDNNYNQIGFALEILRLLVEKPYSRDDLGTQLREFLEKHGHLKEDINGKVIDMDQRIGRTIKKLRECGFEIRSAPNRPYELTISSFPVFLSSEQRQSLALAAYFLSQMGFSAQASHLLLIGGITDKDLPKNIKVEFSPPANYSEEGIAQIVHKLEERFRQKRRYVIRYRSAQGAEKNWDCDLSEFRFHDGVLYLFTWLPDISPKILSGIPNVEQNYAFRVDRILSVGAASQTPWTMNKFCTFDARYRMIGDLSNYQPRRINEKVSNRDPDGKFVEIVATEDHIFWFRQRILQYSKNVIIIEPDWLIKQIIGELEALQQAYQSIAPHSTAE